MNPSILFILKYRQSYGCDSYSHTGTSGLKVSAMLVQEMLLLSGIEANLVEVVDNNDIDRAVTLHRPTHVVVEALWVVPEKFDVLKRLHPSVKWIVRIHSKVPFLSNEGVAVDWIYEYIRRGVTVAFNSQVTADNFRSLTSTSSVAYLPNYYHAHKRRRQQWKDKHLHIGCFGAVRPMKNTLIQAIAAIEYARLTGEHLYFHINGTRTEQGGEQNLRNVRALFAHVGNADLIEYPWLDHTDFMGIAGTMDIGMQVSYTETFNIVTADMVTRGVPVVVSPEIEWVSSLSKADPNSVADIVGKLKRVRNSDIIMLLNRRGLAAYSKNARQTWVKFLGAQQ